MLGAVAAGACTSLGQTMATMSSLGQLTGPSTPRLREFHRRTREVNGLLRSLDRESREAMRGFEANSG
jgi:D-ribulokinase